MKRVLVCVLDWGLGHATRSIPVIRELQRLGADVVLASSNDAGKLLRQEFPRLNYHELPGYAPVYQSAGSMMLAIAAQTIKFSKAIQMEHREVEALVKSLRVDAVVSDNRYGCYSQQVPSVFITHQYRVRLPGRWSAMEPLVNRWQESHFKHFGQLWVPDQPGSQLTAPFVPGGAPVRYIGWLSRFGQENPAPTGYPVVAVVSGPEPQRKLFADKLRRELAISGMRSLLVTGQPGEARHEQDGALEVLNHLPAREMEQVIRSAGTVIARSGYSTIMDLIALGKKAVLVPTPQQPEQMILAKRLQELRVAFCPDQENFVLQNALKEADAYLGLNCFRKKEGLLETAIQELLL